MDTTNASGALDTGSIPVGTTTKPRDRLQDAHKSMVEFVTKLWQKGGLPRFTLVTACLFLIALIPTLRGISEENDFNIFYSAAMSLRNGENMYNGPHLYGMWYYYSPLFASLLVPFTFLPLVVLKLVWLGLSLWMLYRISLLIFRFLPAGSETRAKGYIAMVAVTTVHAVFLNLLHGQMTILVLWCSLEAAWQGLQGNLFRSGLSLSAGINVKILPVFFLFQYTIQRKFRLLATTVLCTALLVLIPYLFLKPSFHNELLAGWFDMINPLKAEHINTTGEGGFIDFASLITKYGTDAVIATEAQLNVVNLTEYEVFLIQTIYRIGILVLAAWLLLRVHTRLPDLKERAFADMALMLLLIPAAFPHQRDYSILMCVPAFILLLHSYFIQNFRPSAWIAVIILLAVTAMGSLFFLELLGHRMRVFLYETRLNGIGLQVFIPFYIFWMMKFVKMKSAGLSA